MATKAEEYDDKTHVSAKPAYVDSTEEGSMGPPERTLKRQLKNRHIAMIRCVALAFDGCGVWSHVFSFDSIGGVIGTGCK